ncbi:MAG: tetratricopeptide repeat protein, partial [Deltaproteobacteria bacterium]|nr:tetratricopeptide repeat protein [Deltaproteobacteria bacterium]
MSAPKRLPARRRGLCTRGAVLLSGFAALGLLGCPSEAPRPKTPAESGLKPSDVTAPGAEQAVMPEVSMTDTAPSAPAPGAPAARELSPELKALYEKAMAAFAAGNIEEAKVLFEKVTRADAKAHQAYYSLGAVQERLGDKGAAGSYQKAFAIMPDYEPAIVAFGLMLAKQGAIDDADAFLTERRARMAKSANIAAALAEVKSLRKNTAEAQDVAQEALKIDPNCRAAMMVIARDHYRNRRLDLSLYALKAILDGFDEANPPRDKNNAEGHLLRGLIWLEQGLTV